MAGHLLLLVGGVNHASTLIGYHSAASKPRIRRLHDSAGFPPICPISARRRQDTLARWLQEHDSEHLTDDSLPLGGKILSASAGPNLSVSLAEAVAPQSEHEPSLHTLSLSPLPASAPVPRYLLVASCNSHLQREDNEQENRRWNPLLGFY
jgi:hypothetical protein